MFDLLFSQQAAWFTIPAIVGTGIFIIRLVLMLVGGDSGLDLDIDTADTFHGDPSEAFSIVSIQSLTAFGMGFGWTGLAAYKGIPLDMPPSLVIGLVGGVGMVWLLALMLKGLHDLQSSGNVDITQAQGREGDVYVTVPGREAQTPGRGQVRVNIANRQRIYNAVTEGDSLPSGTRVRITKVNEDRTLTVARA